MTSNINLSDYYSKISQMRNKILSKHQPNQTPVLKVSEIRFGENINAASPPKRYTTQNPLTEVNENRRTIDCRVQELDNINDKIKNILAQKRSVQKNSGPFAVQRPPSLYKSERIYQNNIKVPQTLVQEPIRRRLDFIQEKGTSFMKQKEEVIQQSISNIKKKSIISNDYQSLWNKGQPSSYRFNNLEKDNKNDVFLNTKPHFTVSELTSNEKEIEIGLKSPERQKLVRLLLQQIDLDRKLREVKEKYEYCNKPEKEKALLAAFEGKGIKISKEQIEAWVHFAHEQSNPFLPIVSSLSIDFDEIVSKVIEAKQHWQKILAEAISIKNLERQSFKISEIDIQEKGHISIEDLVCYLNMNSPEGALRNRDIFSLFQRLKKTESTSSLKDNRLKYETFLGFIAK